MKGSGPKCYKKKRKKRKGKEIIKLDWTQMDNGVKRTEVEMKGRRLFITPHFAIIVNSRFVGIIYSLLFVHRHL